MIIVGKVSGQKKKIAITVEQIISLEEMPNNKTKIATTNKNAVYLMLDCSMEEILNKIHEDVLIIHMTK